MTYANGYPVTETPHELCLKTGPLDVREAFDAGARSQARHWQEEIPPHLLEMVNRIRALAVAPCALNRRPADILQQALFEFEPVALLEWSA